YERLPAPRPVPFDVLEATRAVIQLHQSQGIPIHFDASPCPPLCADRDQFVQILTNLIQNAQDALEGRPDPRIRLQITHRPERNAVVLTFQDNWPGLPAGLQAPLFCPYATSKAHAPALGPDTAQRLSVVHCGDLFYATSNEPVRSVAPAAAGQEAG